MDLKNKISIPLEHHAYLIESSSEDDLDKLIKFLERSLGVSAEGSPDFWIGEHDTFGIDEGRLLRDMQLRKPSIDKQRLFVVALNSITSEAQNSLLKVFEEPSPSSHFFVLLSSADVLLPTLRSRMQTIDSLVGLQEDPLAVEFVKEKASKRMSIVQDIIAEKDSAKALRLLDGLEVKLRASKAFAEDGPNVIKALEYIREARGYLRGRSPSYKLILENLALITPII